MKRKFRIIRIKEVRQIAKHNLWKEGLPKVEIDKMLAIPHIESMVYAYYKTGDSYVFHSKENPFFLYWCVSRSYLLEKYPKILDKIENENKR